MLMPTYPAVLVDCLSANVTVNYRYQRVPEKCPISYGICNQPTATSFKV